MRKIVAAIILSCLATACSSESDLERLTKIGADSDKVKTFASSPVTNGENTWYGLPLKRVSFRTEPEGVVSVYLEFPRKIGYADIALAMKENRKLDYFQKGPRLDAEGSVDGHPFRMNRSSSQGITYLVVYDYHSFKGASKNFKGYVEYWADNRCFEKGIGWRQFCSNKQNWVTVSFAN